MGRDSGLGGFRAFVARALVGRILGEGFGLWWGGLWAFVGGFGLLRWVSGLRGIWAFVGRIWAFVGKDSGVRRKRFELSWGLAFAGRFWGFVGIWVFVGVRAFVGRDWGFRIDCTNLRPRAASLKRTDFANRIEFTRLRVRAAPFKEGVDLGAELRWRTLNPKP